ncbi:hypothetical protein Moror_11922, partial [Moniliophthora roreri MCA 2997]
MVTRGLEGIGNSEDRTGEEDNDKPLGSKAPIHRIPAELLEKIFLYCLPHPVMSTRPLGFHFGVRRPWFHITRVCRYWRTVALNFRILWTTPDFELPSLARAMLERSKPLPLDIFVPRLRLRSLKLDMLAVTLNEMDRIKTVHLNLSSSSTIIQDFILKLVERLSILHTIHVEYVADSWSAPVVFALLVKFLGDDAPNLTEIYLQNCRLSQGWDSPLLHQNITSFIWDVHDAVKHPFGSISEQQETSPGMYSTDFFKALENMPLLEVLELDHILPHSIPRDAPVVALPRLRRLRLVTCGFACFDVLRHLSFTPNLPIIHVGCDTGFVMAASSEELEPLFAIVMQQISGISFRALWIGNVERSTERGVRLQAWSNTPSDIERAIPTSTSTTPDVTIEFVWRGAVITGARRVVDAALPIFPIDMLETLHIGFRFGVYDAKHFISDYAALRHYSTIKNLIVTGPCAYQILFILSFSAQHVNTLQESDDHGQLDVLPSLTALTFTHVDFASPGYPALGPSL